MLRITKQADYGIVLLTCLASASRDTVMSARDLAESARLSPPTASKILKALGRAGLLDSQRGVKGGYTLARPAAEITIASIIEAVDGPISLTECTGDDGNACDIEPTCPVRMNWQRINDAVRDALLGVSLEEMVVRFPIPATPEGATQAEL